MSGDRLLRMFVIPNIRIGLLTTLLWLLCACDSRPVERPKITYLDSPRESRTVIIKFSKKVILDGVKEAVARYVMRMKDSAIAVGGVWPEFEETVDINITGANEVLEGSYYLEIIRPEKYYGLGVCRWRLELLDITSIGHPRVR